MTPSARVENSPDRDAIRSIVGAKHAATTEVPAIAVDELASPGRPLDGPTRVRMEERFGHPFEHVRVHTGARADEAADALGAKAYTAGPHIVFGSGYAPGSPKSEDVLAHELRHVVVTDRTGVRIDPRRVTPADHPSEREVSAASGGLAPGPLTVAPVGLALARRDDEASPRSETTRRVRLSDKRSLIQQVAFSRLNEAGLFVDQAVTDFSRSVDEVLGNNIDPLWSYLTTTGASALGQLVRINVLSSPYGAGGVTAILGAGLPHTLVTIGVAAIALLVVDAILEANQERRALQATGRSFGENARFSHEAASNKTKEMIDQRLDEVFANPAYQDALLDLVSAEEVVDALGIPEGKGKQVYPPVRRALQISFSTWFETFGKPARLFNLGSVQRGLVDAEQRVQRDITRRGFGDVPPVPLVIPLAPKP